jgi:glyoxylase-like metal-dependent hydrolase (beta-lactamase superfamily II)
MSGGLPMTGLGTAKRLWALDSPTFTVEAHTLMYGLTGKLTIPMPAYLIEHPRGLVLFDTGLVPAAIDDPHAVYGELAELTNISAQPHQRLDRQIEALGYKLSDVTHVIASHAHFDHSGGLYLFPQAKFYAGQGEMQFAYWPAQIGAGFFRLADLDATRGFNWHEIPGMDVDLFGDGSLVILFTPGHTPGELSLLVRLASRNFILTGDTVHLRAALESEIHFPVDADTAAAVQSLRRLKLLRDSADATVWITHDPEDWAELQHAPRCYE